jgi:hypothetical protein
VETSEQRKIINPVNVMTWISNFSVLFLYQLPVPIVL